MLWSSSCLILYPFFRIDPVTPPSGEYGWSLMLCLNWVCFPWAGIPTDHVFWGARKISRYWRRESKRIEYGSHWSPQIVYTGVLFKALDGRWKPIATAAPLFLKEQRTNPELWSRSRDQRTAGFWWKLNFATFVDCVQFFFAWRGI